MCLDSGQTCKRTFIKKLKIRKDKYVRLWKVFDVDKDGNLVAQFYKYSFYEGKNTAKGSYVLDYQGNRARYQYPLGFHCFRLKKDAEKWKEDANNDHNRERVVMSVKVRKSWITTVGIQSHKTVLVCKHIFI